MKSIFKNLPYPQINRSNIVIVGVISILGIIGFIFEFSRVGDFKIFLDAGVMLKQHRNIYVYNEFSQFKYYYSPLFAVFLSFFSGIPQLVPILIWKALNLFFIYRIWTIIEREYLDYSNFTPRNRLWFQIAVFTASLFLLFKTIHLAQMTLFMIFSIVEGLYRIQIKKQVFIGALLLAVSVNIKIMPVVIVPYLLYRKEIVSVVYFVAISMILLYLPILFIGIEYNQFLLSEWWKSINPFQTVHVLDVNERGFHSLSSLFAALFSAETGNQYNLDIRRNILDLGVKEIGLITNIARGILILFTLKVLNTKPFEKSPGKIQSLWEISYIMLITPLIFPHQQVYGFLFSFPAGVYVIYYLFTRRKPARFSRQDALVILAFFIINLEMFFGFIREYLFHFKSLTYGILLLLFCLIRFSPHKLTAYQKDNL